jgi:hypothetical protein
MTCSYRTCGNELPTARLPERSESVRLSGTLCRVLAVLAVAGVRRRHPVAGADAPGRDPGEQKHIITGRLVDWATRDGGGAGQAADAVRSVLDEFLPGRYLSSVLSSAPRKQRSGAERTAARGHGERTQTRSGQRAGHHGPEADREHAVEDLCVACARARLPTRLTVHPHEIAGVFTGGHRGTLRDGRALEGLATAGPGDERRPQRTPTADRRPPTADYRLCHGP